MNRRSIWTTLLVVAASAAALAIAAPRREPVAAGAPICAASIAAVADTKLALFNGKDMTGWKQILQDPKADPAKTWAVSDGVIHCTGVPPGYIRTEKAFKNYFLVVEWRWPAEPDNSGVLLHMQREDKVWPYSVEAQLQNGNAGDFWLIDGATAKVDDTRRNPGSNTNVKHLKAAENKPGEWNRYEITCIDGTVILVINGELMNIGRDCTPNEGFICLQSEGKPIDFRKVELTPIP